MEPKNVEERTELVLDNRKLILGFALLVALCGASFVIGFMEGKRQAIQAKVDSLTPAIPPAAIPGESTPPAAIKITEMPAGSTPAKDRSVREQLDWYKSVQGNDSGAAKSAPPTSKTDPAAQPKTTAPNASDPAKAYYTVQVGAFRNVREAETKAEAAKSKGFPCTIEPPKAPEQLYFVKVGKFASRAEASAMKNKLTKAGFSCYVKIY
jgi:cell division protein FtsN